MWRSIVEKSCSGSRVLPKAIPIEASARAARTPPCTRPIGLCKRLSTGSLTVHSPGESGLAGSTWNPINCEIGAKSNRSDSLGSVPGDVSGGLSGESSGIKLRNLCKRQILVSATHENTGCSGDLLNLSNNLGPKSGHVFFVSGVSFKLAIQRNFLVRQAGMIPHLEKVTRPPGV